MAASHGFVMCLIICATLSEAAPNVFKPHLVAWLILDLEENRQVVAMSIVLADGPDIFLHNVVFTSVKSIIEPEPIPKKVDTVSLFELYHRRAWWIMVTTYLSRCQLVLP